MGCIRVDKILDHLCEPLRKCLNDDDPYVRKTAAICVAKLWDLDQERAIENGFVTILQELVSDSNPMVKRYNNRFVMEANNMPLEKNGPLTKNDCPSSVNLRLLQMPSQPWQRCRSLQRLRMSL
jgi:vesicle coat complex subunit